jgi:hypothetical protein
MQWRPNEVHEVRKKEIIVRLLYFLRDLGINSAHDVAVREWSAYCHILGELIK